MCPIGTDTASPNICSKWAQIVLADTVPRWHKQRAGDGSPVTRTGTTAMSDRNTPREQSLTDLLLRLVFFLICLAGLMWLAASCGALDTPLPTFPVRG